jgi:hypothetical protein
MYVLKFPHTVQQPAELIDVSKELIDWHFKQLVMFLLRKQGDLLLGLFPDAVDTDYVKVRKLVYGLYDAYQPDNLQGPTSATLPAR